MALQSGLQRGQRLFVDAQYQFLRRGRGEDFVEEYFEFLFRNNIETEGRFAHFPNASSHGAHLLGAKVGVEAETHFQLVNRFGGEARDEDLVESFEGVVVALES